MTAQPDRDQGGTDCRVRGNLQHFGLVARDGPWIQIADGQRASVGDLLVCTENDHSVDAGGVPLANKRLLRIEAITARGPVGNWGTCGPAPKTPGCG